MALSEKTRELEQQIRATVESTVDNLRSELTGRLESVYRNLVDSVKGLAPQLPERFVSEDDLSSVVEAAVHHAMQEARQEAAPVHADAEELRHAVAAIDAATSQADVLSALLDGAGGFASRAAVFLVRGEQLSAWRAQGVDGADSFAGQSLDVAADGTWRQLIDGAGSLPLSSTERAGVASLLETSVADAAVAIPMVLRDRTAAVLYADRMGADRLDTAALQTLTYVAALVIETLPLRQRQATATLSPVATPADDGTAEEPAVEADEAQPIEEPAAAGDALLDAPETTGIGGTGIATSAEPAEEPMELDDTQEVEQPLAITEDTELGSSLAGSAEDLDLDADLEDDSEAQALDAGWQVEDAEPQALEVTENEPPSLEVEEAAAPPLEVSEEATYQPVSEPEEPAEPAASMTAPEPEPEPALEPEPPAPEPEPAPETAAAPSSPSPSGSPQVQPPSDVEGPGWAFSATPGKERDADLEARHAEAQRLARLLISEIKLYNEEQVLEGRKNNDVVERLKEDIDRSRQIYDERVDARVRDETDYFYQEMVRVLGAGDPDTLGL